MGRMLCCSKEEMKRGAWTAHEDKILSDYVAANGEGKWTKIPKQTGLKRCGKSCRLRWLNYLRPDIKRGNITPDEEDLIIRLHRLLGNRWSLIAGRLPGRTDNEIKNYWNSNLSKRARELHNRERNYQSHSFTNAIEPEMATPGPQPPIPLPENPPMVCSTSRTNNGAANDLRAMEYVPINASSSTSTSRDDQSYENIVMGHGMDDKFYSIDFLSFDDNFDFRNFCSVTEFDWKSLLGCVVETDISHLDSANNV